MASINKSSLIARIKKASKEKLEMVKVTDYEVLRQEGGALALTFNAGVLPLSPQKIFIDKGSLQLLAKDEQGRMSVIGQIDDAPADVLSAAHSSNGLLVVELSTLGVYSAQTFHSTSFWAN